MPYNLGNSYQLLVYLTAATSLYRIGQIQAPTAWLVHAKAFLINGFQGTVLPLPHPKVPYSIYRMI